MTEREARGWNDSEHDVFTRARAYYTPQSRFLLSSVIFEAQGRGWKRPSAGKSVARKHTQLTDDSKKRNGVYMRINSPLSQACSFCAESSPEKVCFCAESSPEKVCFCIESSPEKVYFCLQKGEKS